MLGVHELNEFAIPTVNSTVGSGTPCYLTLMQLSTAAFNVESGVFTRSIFR